MRELTTISIKKISLVGTPANKKSWLMKKSDDGDGVKKDVAEIMAAVSDFLGEGFQAVNEINEEEFLKLVATLKQYQPSFPDDIANVVSALVSFTASTFSDEIKDNEVNKVDDPNNPYPSIPEIKPAHLIEKADDEPEPDPEPSEMDFDPVALLARVEKHLSGEKEEVDNWPSLASIVPGGKVAVVKAEPIKKRDPDEKQKAISKQIQNTGDEANLNIKKVDDEEDLYPSISNELFYRP